MTAPLYPFKRCFSNALQFALQLLGWETEHFPAKQRRRGLPDIENKLFVVHGKIYMYLKRGRHLLNHAWVEYNGLVYDPTFDIIAPVEQWYGSGLGPVPIVEGTSWDSKVLRVGGAIAEGRYPVLVALRTSFSTRTAGPWTPEEVDE